MYLPVEKNRLCTNVINSTLNYTRMITYKLFFFYEIFHAFSPGRASQGPGKEPPVWFQVPLTSPPSLWLLTGREVQNVQTSLSISPLPDFCTIFSSQGNSLESIHRITKALGVQSVSWALITKCFACV